MTPSLLKVWERYWLDLPGDAGAAPWDCAPEHAAATHLPLLAPYFTPDLPLIDVGCGSGTQTRHLAAHYPRVIGIDHAPAAVARARAADVSGAAEYRVVDLLDRAAVAALRGELGDANVYVRCVLHQMEAADRPVAAASIAHLLGKRGHLLDIELTPAAGPKLRQVMTSEAEPCPKLRRALVDYGLTPATWSEDELERLIRDAGLTPVTQGTGMLTTTESLADGTLLTLPTSFVIARPGS